MIDLPDFSAAGECHFDLAVSFGLHHLAFQPWFSVAASMVTVIRCSPASLREIMRDAQRDRFGRHDDCGKMNAMRSLPAGAWEADEAPLAAALLALAFVFALGGR